MADWIQDGGHGGTDPGAVAKGNTEKVYTLEAALYVNKRLAEHGIGSDVTRTADTTLAQGARTSTCKKYLKGISHHFNAGGGSGVETIHSIYADGKFEYSIINEFIAAGYPVRPKPVYFKKYGTGDYYYMHRETGACRVTIIEYDFVDGPQSEKIKDKKYREGMYECVVRAICKEEGVPYKPIVQPKPVTAPTSGLYKVQVGAFSQKENADRLAAELKAKGYSTYIVHE
ncbi:N-acetylmuramoyl-L-alanine amidase [Bacillus sp. MRMR6]|uniref:N-acetylmuramoyl-L-alanine amidase n=1 Tax=Bacillus sp. MRMR6 TaxID=1928617 RepID=UPI000950CB31|nr:N-acetylmuramoyl-L-alanine amidase [Bacillus sp. MRMR6]OLS39153.1 hypothetical protein BTR25_13560 [Bacillus sp. MRMR6]